MNNLIDFGPMEQEMIGMTIENRTFRMLNMSDEDGEVAEAENAIESITKSNVTTDSQSHKMYKYVQIKRNIYQSGRREHIMLQIIDVSSDIMYDVAQGEKKLLSLINATVSHEMRNPVNSIKC